MRLFTLLLIGCVSVQASAADIHVPADQPTIQAGINAAIPGDVVIVAPGTYNESIDFLANADLLTVTKGQQEDVFGREEGIPITEELDPDTDHSELLDPDAAPPYEEQTFDLTEDGKIVAERLQEKLSREDWERIKSIKRKYADRSLTSLLAYVYRTYPESASESEIRHLF
ncbi:MAG: hypothetical protein IID30_03260 [Planctomycetes bacterium]|nr:hypothetical protein [Planctomycetota bacterium]